MQEYIKIQSLVKTELNSNREFTEIENQYIKIWITQYDYNFDMISLAFYYTTNKENPNFEYLHKIISEWYKKGFKSRTDVSKWLYEKKMKK